MRKPGKAGLRQRKRFMETLWYLLAALGAGVGTGLAGLSAATVMVPILIVLCPSFSGESGVYQATAIALASDILGSAVTTLVYWRHGNIDLKRGWIMAACITSMCIAGSVAAYFAGNVVLGNFSLFLTFCIGIRFLVSPDTQRKETAARGSGLGPREIAVSLFFGLTIGFGTGFVGTGGGMMMLVVFTVFLGMELKSAVGTSTFIMTFTALIASVSHMLIEPAILTQRWDALLLCVSVSTAASLLSARFANRVSNRTVGVVTGAVLFFLGGSMLCLHYRDALTALPLFRQVLACCAHFLRFVLSGASLLILLHLIVRIPDYIFRKLLHIIAFSCLVIMTVNAQTWTAAAATSLLFAAVVYPILSLLEGFDFYTRLFVQKKPGEIKRSLLLLFIMYAFLVAVCWGLFDLPAIANAATLMWGVGDAAAALFGIRFGKHPVKLRLSDGKKTWEGSAAMCLSAFAAGLIALLATGDLAVWRCILYPLLAAPFSAFTELATKNGDDTVTVPTVTAAVLLLLRAMF